MGQQQLLLIILGVIIVGIAVAVGITMFTGAARDSNRDAVINDLVNLAARAQQYYRRPVEMGGGAQTYAAFALATADQGNANGTYKVVTDLEATANQTAVQAAAIVPTVPGAGAATIYIKGWGNETGNDDANPVQVYVTVTVTGQPATVVN